MGAGSIDFARDYSLRREAEGRGYTGKSLSALPYLRSGSHGREWGVRARSYESLLKKVVRPRRRAFGRPLRVIDLGAGNGWLSYRLAMEGDQAVAVDVRNDNVDGLGAARELASKTDGSMTCCTAAFDDVPLESGLADLAVFNASLHYAADLRRALTEAFRLLAGDGLIIVMDSPFYRSEADGAAMIQERGRFGPSIQFLTRNRLERASRDLQVRWTRHRVRYPVWYELRPLVAAFTGRRRPSRFDLWIGSQT
jgi:SAM-dependent methyltransferase